MSDLSGDWTCAISAISAERYSGGWDSPQCRNFQDTLSRLPRFSRTAQVLTSDGEA
jgi:hypothetical protein